MTKTRIQKLLLLAGFVGPILFLLEVFLIFPLFYPEYSVVTQYISELGGMGSPVASLVNILVFNVTGILIALFGVGVYRLKRWGIFGHFSAFFIFLTGVLMFFVGVFQCELGCVNNSFQGFLHYLSANAQYPTLATGLVLFALEDLHHRSLKWLVPVIIILGSVSLIIGYNYLFIGSVLESYGLFQRINVFSAYLLLILISWSLYKYEFPKRTN